MKKVIYDLGSNNGDDIPYYLKKCDLVVAVEANPDLCSSIKKRFSSDISDGRLVVENSVISHVERDSEVPFYVHKSNHVLSQFPRPSLPDIGNFQEILLPSITVPQLVEKWGNPYYIKIDLEHYDAPVLRSILEAEIYPPYLSAESHSAEIFCLLVAQGGYKSFKLVEGSTVQQKFAELEIEARGGKEQHSFPPHSAGPFGDDIPGPWFTADKFIKLLGVSGLGWKDIHVSREHGGDLSVAVGDRSSSMPIPGLAMSRTLEKYQTFSAEIDGWFSEQSAAIWDSFLSYQKNAGLNGHLLEIGVWKGKSALLSAIHAGPKEIQLLVDPLPLDTALSNIRNAGIAGKVDAVQIPSRALRKHPEYGKMRSSFRWIHLDGRHTAQDLSHDMAMAEELLTEEGMLVLDDFFAPAYPQVTEAVFQYLLLHPNQLRLVLCGYQKGYLCRPLMHKAYINWVAEKLHLELKDRGIMGVTLWKSTPAADANVFGITDQFLDFTHRGPDWDQNTISV